MTGAALSRRGWRRDDPAGDVVADPVAQSSRTRSRRILQLGEDRAQRRRIERRVEVATTSTSTPSSAPAAPADFVQRGCGRSLRRPWPATSIDPQPRRRSGDRRGVLRQRGDVVVVDAAPARGPGRPGISDAALGLTLVGMGLGGLAASLFSGWLVDRRGSRTMTMTTSAAMSLWLPLLGVAPTAVLVFADPAGARRPRRIDRRGDELPGSRAAAARRAIDHHPLPRAVVARCGDRRDHRQPRRRRRGSRCGRNCSSPAACSS